MYVRNILDAIQVDELVDDVFEESMWCKIRLKNSDLLLFGCIYRSPSSSKENSHHLNNLLNKACAGVFHI